MIDSVQIMDFATESNEIEGIQDYIRHFDHCSRLTELLDLAELTYDAIVEFNTAGAIRSTYGMNVMVGNYVPPRGGISMPNKLKAIIDEANDGVHPFLVHLDFEHLHPFMDGNGRTGRAIWLWQMIRQQNYKMRLPFLQKFYYQSLDFHHKTLER